MGQHNVRTTKFSSAMEILPFVFLGRVVRVYRGTAEIWKWSGMLEDTNTFYTCV